MSAQTVPADTLDCDTISAELLHEVVVTAREARNASSASIIDTVAMKHLQPSSFTDLLALLPGGITTDPVMGAVNTISLRQATNITPTDDYATSALGTAFIIDGVAIDNNARMANTTDANYAERNAQGKGTDMRAISTDDIERVEVVRGIASAEYGEMTSGLINIRRKTGISGLQARFKADTQSQLFYLGKGFRMPGREWTLNIGADYLDSRIDPRNSRENFKRVTGSVRSNKRWGGETVSVNWTSSINYTGTFERDRNDPDLTVNNTIDYYTSDRHGLSWNNTLSINSIQARFWRGADFTAAVSYTDGQTVQDKHVAPSRVMPLPMSMVAGDNYVDYLPMLYLAHLDVFDRPFSAVLKGSSRFEYAIGQNISNRLKAGVEWNMSKNYGAGRVYDINRPISASMATRPRAFSEIPAMHILSAFVEQTSSWHGAGQRIDLTLGLRETQLLHLDSRFALSHKPYLDPRVNLVWTPAKTYPGGRYDRPIIWELAAGIGLHTKMPVAAYLYPDACYTDFEQLNYYHNNADYRVMNVRTYVEDLTNYDLRAARNLKWEVRGDVSFMGNRLSVTYFRERMSDGFRFAGIVHRYTYNRYDASGYDPVAAGGAPTIDVLTYTEQIYLATRSTATNGSSTNKQGVEYTFMSRRFPSVRTRVTVNGAWFRTVNRNSEPLWYKPGVVVNGKELQYVGLYDDYDGSVYSSFNTNVMFDTDIPRLGLNFSLTVQNVWFTRRQTLWADGVPTHYLDSDMKLQEYTEISATDPYLSQLIRTYGVSAFNRYTVPVATTFNLKASKTFWSGRVGIALYVNRIAAIMPSYTQNGILQRRYSTPYFGMELNLKI